MNSDILTSIESALGCRFADHEDLKTALTHASAGADANYERLEFLGDRVLGLAMADLLYVNFPQESEGDLAKRHAALVQGSVLAGIAREIGLGAALRLSEAERAAGGAGNDNILADGLEAVIGALYLDSGFGPCRVAVQRLWAGVLHTMTEPPQDPKTALQEWVQGRGFPLPVYEIAGRRGPDHAPEFDIRVTAAGQSAQAAGPSRRLAEKEAARLLLDRLAGSERHQS